MVEWRRHGLATLRSVGVTLPVTDKQEENFKDLDLTRTVHLGWGALGGAAGILFCMGMSMATQGRSWNVSFMWLQRRVGAQFGTMSYIITSNLLYYHDGDRWITRDWPSIMERWTSRRRGGRGVPLEQ